MELGTVPIIIMKNILPCPQGNCSLVCSAKTIIIIKVT